MYRMIKMIITFKIYTNIKIVFTFLLYIAFRFVTGTGWNHALKSVLLFADCSPDQSPTDTISLMTFSKDGTER